MVVVEKAKIVTQEVVQGVTNAEDTKSAIGALDVLDINLGRVLPFSACCLLSTFESKKPFFSPGAV